MRKVTYIATLPLLYLLSVMPMRVLYLLSDLMYYLAFHLISYRRDVVRSNLQGAFPEYDIAEIEQIEREFYTRFCDVIVETVKLLTISRRAVRRMISFHNLEVLSSYFTDKKDVIVLMGHLGNWELSGLRLALEPLHDLHIVYHSLKNPHFERLIHRMRTRFGNKLYPMHEAVRVMLAKSKDISATVLISDQSPARDNLIWTMFLNRQTAFFSGPGRIAALTGLPVLYASVRRVRRGRYLIHFTVLTDTPATQSPQDITDRYARQLGADIRSAPADWLWTHRRWKHNG